MAGRDLGGRQDCWSIVIFSMAPHCCWLDDITGRRWLSEETTGAACWQDVGLYIGGGEGDLGGYKMYSFMFIFFIWVILNDFNRDFKIFDELATDNNPLLN